MSKKKQEPLPLDKQLETYIVDAVEGWEAATGMRIDCIEIRHKRPIGFNQKERISINVILL